MQFSITKCRGVHQEQVNGRIKFHTHVVRE